MSLGCLNCRLLIMDGQFCSKKCEIEYLTECRNLKIDGMWLELERLRRGKITDKTESKAGGKDGN